MTRDIVQYGFLLVLLFCTFAFSGRILFNTPQFSSFQETLITLFSWMLGEFSFEAMEEEGWEGQLFLALYLVTCMLLMVNFLIALLSTTYSFLADLGSSLHLQSVLETQPRWAFHPEFNVLTIRVPVLNVISLLLLPCFVKCPARKRVLF